MQKRSVTLLPLSLFFLLLSIFLFFSTPAVSSSLSGVGASQGAHLIQESVFFIKEMLPLGDHKGQDQQLLALGGHAANQQDVQEMRALQDQFQTTSVQSSSLLPTKIIGFEGYIPGVSRPTDIIVDKGEKDGVHRGQAVVYKDNLVGKVTKTEDHRSLVVLLTKSGWSFTAMTSDTHANGLVSINDGNIFMQNVVLSDKLSKDDLVITKGDETLAGGGFPPGIVIGKILSVDKKTSALFQSAKVKSFIDVPSLSTVFIYIE